MTETNLFQHRKCLPHPKNPFEGYFQFQLENSNPKENELTQVSTALTNRVT
jgi:hypothetical protein